MTTKQAVASASTKAVAALRVLVRGKRGPAELRAAAHAIMDLRQCFEHEGIPDWAGRTPEYRMKAEEVYRKAGVPSDSEDKLQSALRYHIGNVLREQAPPEHLDQLGLAKKGPRGRTQELRETRRMAGVPARSSAARRPNIRVAPGAFDPVQLVQHARADIALIRSAGQEGTVDPETILPALRALMDEVLDAVSELH